MKLAVDVEDVLFFSGWLMAVAGLAWQFGAAIAAIAGGAVLVLVGIAGAWRPSRQVKR